MKFFKLYITQFVALSGLAIGLSGCIFDKFDEETNTGLDMSLRNMKYYVNFQLETVGGGSLSRAADDETNNDMSGAMSGDFIDGSKYEHSIGNSGNYAIFFNKSNTLWKVLPLALSNEIDGEDYNGQHYEACYTATFTSEDFEPTYDLDDPGEDFEFNVLIVVNANGTISSKLESLEEGTTKDYVLNQITDSTYESGNIGTNGYLTMSNAVFLGDGGKHTTVRITKDNIQERPFFDRNKVVHVVIERMLAKFSFSDSSTTHYYTSKIEVPYCDEIKLIDGDYAPVNVPVTWRAKVTGWGMNGQEQEQYLFRNISESGNYFSNWNEADLNRCYWAEDKNYSGKDYPRQYRKPVNKKLNSYSGNQVNILKNYSFNLLNNDFNATLYTPENTYSYTDTYIKSLGDRRDLLAGTHLIVCALLELNVGGNWISDTDFWRTETGTFYTDPIKCFWSLVRSLNHDLETQSQMKFIYYDWNSSTDAQVEMSGFTHRKGYCLYLGDTRLDSYEAVKKALEDANITDPFDAVNIVGGDGRVLPWIENLKIRNAQEEELRVFDKIVPKMNEKDEYVFEFTLNGETYTQDQEKIVGINANTNRNYLRSFIYEWLGALDHFSGGRMYYAAPARLHGADSDSNMIFGTVRNNWYQYNLLDITRIGTSVDNPDEPVVPDKVYTEDQLNINVKILGWHVFEEEAGVLPKN